MRKLAPKMASRLGVMPHSEILNRIAVNAIPLTTIVTTDRANKTMRLQGFPNSFTPHETDSIAYEHAGNAVNAKIVREIADNLFTYIK